MFALLKIFSSLQNLAGRTDENIIVGIVAEGFFGEDAFFGTSTFLGLLQGIKMRLYSAILTGQIIFDCSVFAVKKYRLYQQFINFIVGWGCN